MADANVHYKCFEHNDLGDLEKQFNNFILRNDLHFMGPNFNTFYYASHKGKHDLIFCNN